MAHAAKRPVDGIGEGSHGGAKFRVSGLTCPECAAQFERALNGLDGMERAELNFGAGLLFIKGPYGPNEIIRFARRAGLQAVLLDRMGKARPGRKAPSEGAAGRIAFLLLAFLFIAGGVAVRELELTWPPAVLEYLPEPVTLERAVFALALFYGGYHPVIRACSGLWRRRVEASFLAVCAAAGALLLDRWMEAACVVTLFAAGDLLQASYMDRIRRTVWSWRERIPGRAVRLAREQGDAAGERSEEVSIEEIAPGDTCLVLPGEVFPVDGVIVQGASAVSASVLGGAQLSTEKREGERVDAGSVNGGEAVHVRAERPAAESGISLALDVLEEALGAPGPGQKWVHRLAAVATPFFLFAAVALATLPSLVLGEPIGPWLYAGLILLVLAQPCVLALCVPAACCAALVSCAKSGVLARSGEALGRLARVDTLAFGPDAVLTGNRLDVFEVLPLAGWSQQRALALAAGVVWGRDDAIANAVVEAAVEAESGIVMVDAASADEFGNAVATVGDQSYVFGELKSLERRGVALTPVLAKINALRSEGMQVALLVEGKEPVALFSLIETVKEGSRRAIARLRKLGIDRLVMVCEKESRASALAAALLELDRRVVAPRPAERTEAVKELQREGRRVGWLRARAEEPAGGRSPVPAADVALTYGPLAEAGRARAADIMLIGDDLEKLPFAVAFARRMVRIARQNLAAVAALKAAGLVLLFFGTMRLWMAAGLELAAAALVVLNSRRLLRRTPSGGASPAGRSKPRRS